MLRLFIAEIKYRISLFSITLALIPLLAFYARAQWHSITATFILFWALVMVLQNMVIIRNKDNLERLYALLPISHWRYAAYRTFSILILAAMFCFYYFVWHLPLNAGGAQNPKHLLTLALIIWIIFSTYFLGRDVSLDFFRRLGITRERFMLFAILIGVILQILGLVAFLRASAGKTTHIFFLKWIGWAIHDHPFQGSRGYMAFIVLTVALALFSLWTFVRRNNHLK